MPPGFLPRVAVVLGYVCVAVAFTWPLALHLGSALTGDPGGDTGVYVWNQWVFHHELRSGGNPLRTDRILSLTDRADLSQHNYTVFLNLLALPLRRFLDVVTTFNVVFLASTVLTALFTYALARRVTAATRAQAWLAGVAFAWSPVLLARSTGHFSLVAAAALPAFLLCLRRADQTRRLRLAALAGVCVAWAGYSDAYYAIYCLLMLAGLILSRLVRVGTSPRPIPPLWLGLLISGSAVLGGLVLVVAVGGGRRFEVLGQAVSVRSLYTPVLLLTVVALIALIVRLRPRAVLSGPLWSASALRVLVMGGLACGLTLSPVVVGLIMRTADGRLVNPETLWRSSPRGVDALDLVLPNPGHPLVRAVSDSQMTDGAAHVEYTAALSLVALCVIAWATWRAGFRPRHQWTWLTVGFAVLSLGPFVHVAGLNTHVPGPWALLRYVPIVDTARTPTRFAIVAALGVSILFASALTALCRRFPDQRRVLTVTAGVLLLFELLPAPRTLYSAEVPEFYRTIAADARPVRLIHLPFGVRDGTFTAGNFSARQMFTQTVHQKRIVGGYLSRISRKRVAQMRAQPTLDRLMLMSEGRRPPATDTAGWRARERRFLRRARVGYVVIDEHLAPPHLIDFAIDAWQLTLIAREGDLSLYRPRASR